MPLYDYECKRCHCVFERKQKYDEEPVAICECGGKARRVLHSVPIIFKGTGFYVTDYKNNSSGEGTKTSKEGPKEPAVSDAKSPVASETKPSPAPAAKTAETKASN